MVSKTTISRAFKGRYTYSANFLNGDLVPLDKFKPANIIRAREYIDNIQQIDPTRIKFGDEKLLKGSELYNRKVRRDPDTREVPFIVAKPDFWNTYSIIGFCGIDQETPCFQYSLSECITDSVEWRIALEEGIASGFFRRYNVLVLDRASWHLGGYNTDIEDFCWNYQMEDGKQLKLLILFLPARSPELNPIELLWHNLVQQLKHKFSWKIAEYKQDAVAHAACDIMDNTFDHELVQKCYCHLGY